MPCPGVMFGLPDFQNHTSPRGQTVSPGCSNGKCASGQVFCPDPAADRPSRRDRPASQAGPLEFFGVHGCTASVNSAGFRAVTAGGTFCRQGLPFPAQQAKHCRVEDPPSGPFDDQPFETTCGRFPPAAAPKSDRESNEFNQTA